MDITYEKLAIFLLRSDHILIVYSLRPENLDEHVLFKTAVLHNAHRHDQPALRMPNPLNVENFEAPQCRIYHEDYNGIDPTVEML